MNPIPEDAQRLISRLRMLADEIESAARHGVPIPYMVSASGHEHGEASFHATEAEFDAWAEYVAEVTGERRDYEHAGGRWSAVRANVNGLPLGFATERLAAPLVTVVAE